MNNWIADVELTRAQAAALIRSQFPALGEVTLEPLGTGWDNQAWLVNEIWVFRFPRRRIAASLIATEQRHLPALAAHVPVPIPVPIFAGQPDDTYPYPFGGYRMLPGITACVAELSDQDRARQAQPLAAFLRSLHSAPVELASDPPRDEIGRSDLSLRLQALSSRMDRVARNHPEIDMTALRGVASALVTTPAWSGAPCWVHADLYARHILLDEQRVLCGIIDWGDLHVGDPALDLSIVFSFLPPGSRSAFWAIYGEVDPHTVARARFRALTYGIILLDYGHEIADAALAHAGRTALAFALDQ